MHLFIKKLSLFNFCIILINKCKPNSLNSRNKTTEIHNTFNLNPTEVENSPEIVTVDSKS